MLKVSDIREFIRLLDETSLQELSLETENLKLTLKKAASVVSSTVGSPVAELPIQQAVLLESSAANPVTAPPGSQTDRIAPEPQAMEEGLGVITSPMVGTFYRAPSPTAVSYAEIGTKVTEKTVVCIIEAMKLMNEIEADVRGEIVEILAENGQLVEYGQPLFRVKLA